MHPSTEADEAVIAVKTWQRNAQVESVLFLFPFSAPCLFTFHRRFDLCQSNRTEAAASRSLSQSSSCLSQSCLNTWLLPTTSEFVTKRFDSPKYGPMPYDILWLSHPIKPLYAIVASGRKYVLSKTSLYHYVPPTVIRSDFNIVRIARSEVQEILRFVLLCSSGRFDQRRTISNCLPEWPLSSIPTEGTFIRLSFRWRQKRRDRGHRLKKMQETN